MEKLENLTVLRKMLSDPLFSAFVKVCDGGGRAEFLNALFENSAEENLFYCIERLILTDVNAFSKTCAAKKEPSEYLKKSFENDLEIIFSNVERLETLAQFSKGCLSAPFVRNVQKCAHNLKDFYSRYGYGDFIDNRAFAYSHGKLTPIKNASPVTLDELKHYETEKKIIEANILSFIKNLPYSNMLLYGDRGTGKSSTVHAMLNKYYGDGLRIVELSKENILSIPDIRGILSDNPLKFIIFIDDLSLDECDEKISSLKASLEGSLASCCENVMIVATSNRRHIIKESFSDRENSIHPSDSITEQLSLSDRFGLTVNFSTTDKALYLSIVKQLAEDKNINIDEARLFALAERWAIYNGGRSPRRAKQFIDTLYSCTQKGIEMEF